MKINKKSYEIINSIGCISGIFSFILAISSVVYVKIVLSIVLLLLVIILFLCK